MPEKLLHHPVPEAPVHPLVTAEFTPGAVPAPEAPALDALANTPEASVINVPVSPESVALSSLGFESPFEKLGIPSLRRESNGNLTTASLTTLDDLRTEHARLMKVKSDMDNHAARMEALRQGTWASAAAEQRHVTQELIDATDKNDAKDSKVTDLLAKKKAKMAAGQRTSGPKPLTKVAA